MPDGHPLLSNRPRSRDSARYGRAVLLNDQAELAKFAAAYTVLEQLAMAHDNMWVFAFGLAHAHGVPIEEVAQASVEGGAVASAQRDADEAGH